MSVATGAESAESLAEVILLHRPRATSRREYFPGETIKQQSRPHIVRWRQAFVERARLGTTAYAVGLETARYSNGHGVCWPMAETIAEAIGCGEQTVRRGWKKLREAGWLAWQERPGTSHRFQFTVPYPDQIYRPPLSDLPTNIGSRSPLGDLR